MNRKQMAKQRRMLNTWLVAFAVAGTLAWAAPVFAQNIQTNLKGDINKFYDQARNDIASLLGGAGIGSAVILNATPNPVRFYVYNYIDVLACTPTGVAAGKPVAAPGKSVTVAASGVKFKVCPNDQNEFQVAPGKAYVYRGPGDWEEVH